MQRIVKYATGYLKSLQRYKFLNLDTYHPDTVYLREPGNEDRWLFGGAKRGPRVKKIWETHH